MNFLAQIPRIPDVPVATAAQQVAAAAPGGRVVEDYALGKTLGKGHFATVRLAQRLSTRQVVALKIVDFDAENPAHQETYLEREVNAMRSVQHEHVIQLHRFVPQVNFPHEDGRPRTVMLLDLEFARKGELFDYLLQGGAFPEGVCRTYFKQLLLGLKACHDQGVYHRDLKPENILLSDGFQLKIGDFGLASVNPGGGLALLRSACGTRRYQAPEVLAQHVYEGGKVDAWSAGVVLFIMLLGNPPFEIAAGQDWWFNEVQFGRYNRFWLSHERAPNAPAVSEGAKAILNRIFVVDPLQRASVDDLLQDPWMAAAGDLTYQDELRVLNEFMTARQMSIDLQQSRWKQREKAKRQKQAATAARATGPQTFDPRRVTHRSSSSNLGRAIAPEVDPASVGLFVCYTGQSSKQALNAVAHALPQCASPPGSTHEPTQADSHTHPEEGALPPMPSLVQADTVIVTIDPVEVDHERFVVRASGKSNYGEVTEMEIHVWTIPSDEEEELRCIEAVKIRGSTWAFGTMWNSLLETLDREGVVSTAEDLNHKEEAIHDDPESIIF